MSIKNLNHVAVIVSDLDKALTFWEEALGLELARRADVPTEGVSTAFLPVGDSNVELITPIQDDTGVARFLEKRGPGLHHLCFEVDDLEATLQRLTELNVPLINQEPQTGHGGYRYAFVHPKGTGGVLVELYEMAGE